MSVRDVSGPRETLPVLLPTLHCRTSYSYHAGLFLLNVSAKKDMLICSEQNVAG